MDRIRRQKLEGLIATRFGGSGAALAKKAGISEGRVSQLRKPDQPFGRVAAKNLEERLELPAGYFEAMDDETLAWAAMFDAMTPERRAQWVALIQALNHPAPPPKPPNGSAG